MSERHLVSWLVYYLEQPCNQGSYRLIPRYKRDEKAVKKLKCLYHNSWQTFETGKFSNYQELSCPKTHQKEDANQLQSKS